MRAVIEGLKSKGIIVFGATGYCYGGMISISYDRVVRGLSPFPLARLVFDLAFENIIRVAVITHPSLFTPKDLDVGCP